MKERRIMLMPQEGALVVFANQSLKPGQSLVEKMLTLVTDTIDSVSVPKSELQRETLICAGNPSHQHKWQYAEWDRDRLGYDVTDISDNSWFCTFKNLWRCECGAEKIVSERGFV